MKTAIFLFLLASFSCDYREYPQEQEWKEEIEKEEKETDEESAIDQRSREAEVDVNKINFTPANN